MKMKSPQVILALLFTYCFLSGCGNRNNANKDILAGYTEYKACLKACDELEAKYTLEYNNCKQNGCGEEINLQTCYQYHGDTRMECLERQLIIAQAAQKNCQCNLDYINHIKEVTEVRKQCLITYNKRFEVLNK